MPNSGYPAPIVALALALKCDPDLIFEYVYNNIEFEPLYGSNKGPLGTLLDGRGDDADQAILLVTLWNAAGITQTGYYNIDRTTVSGAQVAGWLGVPNDCIAIEQVLVGGGIPFENANPSSCTAGQALTSVDFLHFAAGLNIGGTWYLFDPSFKQHTIVTGIANLGTALGYSRSQFLSDAGGTSSTYSISGINRSNLRSDLVGYSNNLISYINQNNRAWRLADVIGGKLINPLVGSPIRISEATAPSSTFPVDCPNQMSAPECRTFVVIVMPGVSPMRAIKLYTDQVYGHRITISSVPNGSYYTPTLLIDGAPPACVAAGTCLNVGTTASAGTTWSMCTQITEPNQPNTLTGCAGGNVTDYRNLQYNAGGAYLLSLATGQVGRGMAEYHRQLLSQAMAQGNASSSEVVLGESLAALSYNWLAQVSYTQQSVDQLAQSVSNYQFAAGITGQANIGQFGYAGPYIDLPINDITVTARASNGTTTQIGSSYSYPTAALSASLAEITAASSFESTVLLQTQAAVPNMTAASTVMLIDANMNPSFSGSLGTTYLADGTTTAGKNYFTSTIYPAISSHYGAADLASLSSAVSGGAMVLIPSNGLLNVGQWTGAGYSTVMPLTSSEWNISELITGGMHGAYSGLGISDLDFTTNLGAVFIPEADNGTLPPVVILPPAISDFSIQEPVDGITGGLVYSNTDLITGSSGFPYSLPFARTYLSSSGSYLTNTSADIGIGNGWAHTYSISVRPESDPYVNLGTPITPAVTAATSIAALYVIQDLFTPSVTPQSMTAATMATQWFTDQLANNTVQVVQANTTEEFVALPHADGATSVSFTPPPGSSTRLSQTTPGQFAYLQKDGTTFSFGPTPSGSLQSIVYTSGMIVSLSYSGSQLTKVSNNLGRSLTLNYTGNDVTKVTDDSGRYVSYAYDSNHNLTTYTDPLTNNTTFSYDTTGKYDTAAHLTQIFYPTNPTNAFVTNYYDPMGRVAQQANANGINWQFYVAGPRTEIVDATGNRHVTYQTARGKVTNDVWVLAGSFGDVFNDTAQQNGVVDVTLNTYDGIDRPLTVTAPEGDSISYTYVTATNPWANNVASITQTPKPSSSLSPVVESFTYDPNFNKVVSATDGLGLIVQNSYNVATGTLIRTIEDFSPGYSGSHLNATTSFTYNVLGQPLTVTDPVGMVTTNTYDALGSLSSITRDASGANQLSLMGHDNLGNVTTITDPNGNVTTNTYDAKRRLTTTTAPFAPSAPGPLVTTFAYTPDDWLLQTQQSAQGTVLRTTSSTYTLTGKVATTTDANGNVIVFSYDADDRLESRANPLGSVTSYVYDAMSRQTQVSNLAIESAPLLQQAYQPDGRIASLTDANGNTTTYGYDGLNRLQTTTYPAPSGGSSTTETYTYDADNNVITAMTRNSDVIAFSYDSLNRRCTKTIASTPVVCGGSSTNPTTFYNYDLNGKLIAANDNSPSVTTAANPASYSTAYTYDALNRPTNVNWSPTLAQTTPSASSVTFTHAYDGNDRRTGSSYTDTSWMSYPVAAAATTSYTANALNQYSAVGSATPTYNANGNLTYDGVYTYGYDAENRLTSIKQGLTAIASYAYDALGRRKSKTVGSTTTMFVTDADNREVLEYDGTSGSTNSWYSYGLGSKDVLGQMNIASSTRETMIPDVQGSVQATLDASSGALTKAGYQAYGENPSLTSGTFAYTSQRFDAETAGSTSQPSGLYYYRSRMYSPTLGRFLQVDPSGYGGGANLYAYADDDPTNLADTEGLTPSNSSNSVHNLTTEEALSSYAEGIVTSAAQGLAVFGYSYGEVMARSNGYTGPYPSSPPNVELFNPPSEYFYLEGSQFGQIATAMFGGRVLGAYSSDAFLADDVGIGTNVYRVYGENNSPFGQSWTTVDPSTVVDYRNAAGLPNINTGRFVLEGTITDTTGVTTRSALSLDGNDGGLREIVIPNAGSQVKIKNVSGANPPY